MSEENVDDSVLLTWLAEALWRFPRVRTAAWPVIPAAVSRRLLPVVFRRGYVDFNWLGSVSSSNFADDFELYQAAEVLGTVGTFRGAGALDQVIAELREAFDDVRFRPEALTEIEAERFLMIVRFSGTGRGSGVKVDRLIAHVWTMRGPLMARLETYWDPAEALEAAGLSE